MSTVTVCPFRLMLLSDAPPLMLKPALASLAPTMSLVSMVPIVTFGAFSTVKSVPAEPSLVKKKA